MEQNKKNPPLSFEVLQGFYITTKNLFNMYYSTNMGPCFHVFAKNLKNGEIFLCHADNETDFIPVFEEWINANEGYENCQINIGRVIDEENRRPSVYDREMRLKFHNLLSKYGQKIEDNIYSVIIKDGELFLSRAINKEDLFSKSTKFINLNKIKELNKIIKDKDTPLKEKEKNLKTFMKNQPEVTLYSKNDMKIIKKLDKIEKAGSKMPQLLKLEYFDI